MVTNWNNRKITVGHDSRCKKEKRKKKIQQKFDIFNSFQNGNNY